MLALIQNRAKKTTSSKSHLVFTTSFLLLLCTVLFFQWCCGLVSLMILDKEVVHGGGGGNSLSTTTTLINSNDDDNGVGSRPLLLQLLPPPLMRSWGPHPTTTIASNRGTTTTTTTTATNSINFNDHNHNHNANKCVSTTVPVNDNEYGNHNFYGLFPREEIPGLRKQKTNEGKMILQLWAFDGKLHFGYGDESKNTGPISMHAFDPQRQSWTYTGTINSEEVRFFRQSWQSQSGGEQAEAEAALYTPVIDGHGTEYERACGVYYLTCGTRSLWKTLETPINGSAHIYDLAVVPQHQHQQQRSASTSTSGISNRLLVSTGSRTNETAYVMASDDNGKTWETIFRRPSKPGSYTRIHDIGVNETFLFIFGRDPRKHTSFAFYRQYNDDEDNDDSAKANEDSSAAASSLSRNLKNTNINNQDNDKALSSSSSKFHEITNLESIKRKDKDRPPYLVSIMLHDEIIITSHTDVYPLGRYISSYRIVGNELVEVNPWPTINGKETSLLCWTPDTQNPNRLLVMVQMKGTTTSKSKKSKPKKSKAGKWKSLGSASASESQPQQQQQQLGEAAAAAVEEAKEEEEESEDSDDSDDKEEDRNHDNDIIGVFRTSSLHGDPPIWEEALLMEYHDFTTMALLRNDLYLGTRSGNIWVVQEFYKPA